MTTTIARHMKDFTSDGRCACYDCEYDYEMWLHGREYFGQF
jgi:hypothetical protein